MMPPGEGFLKHHFPAASSKLRSLLAGAAEHGGLEAVDFYTLRDLVDLSGCGDENVQALLVCLFLNLREGSVCVELSDAALKKCLDGLVAPQDVSMWAAELAAFNAEKYPALIAVAESGGRPVVVREHVGRRLVYFQKYCRHERALEQHLQARLAAARTNISGQELKQILQRVLVDEAARRKGVVVALNAEQRLAVALALVRNFVVISGGPGTGKTSVVFAALRGLLRMGIPAERVALACPTGRAAQRLSEAINDGLQTVPDCEQTADRALRGLTAQTIHRLLGYHPKLGTFRYHRNNLLPIDVLVCDEVSMVDGVLMARLLDAVPPTAKLILAGDKDQLPSVDAGSVLADLLPPDGMLRFSAALRKQLAPVAQMIDVPETSISEHALEDCVVVLQQNYRSQKQIQEVAAQINTCDGQRQQDVLKLVASLPRIVLSTENSAAQWPEMSAATQGCLLLELPDETRAWHQTLSAWVRAKYLAPGKDGFAVRAQEVIAPTGENISDAERSKLERIFETVVNVRILTLIREGAYGCEGINAYIAGLIQPSARHAALQLYPGAPVLITSNDAGLKLFNGDVGVALKTAKEGLAVVFRRAGAADENPFVAFPLESLPSYELAYALTVHKSQGSEYDEALVVLPPKGAQRLLNKQMLYTALTRARRRVTICGNTTALCAAISRRLERHSGLVLRKAD